MPVRNFCACGRRTHALEFIPGAANVSRCCNGRVTPDEDLASVRSRQDPTHASWSPAGCARATALAVRCLGDARRRSVQLAFAGTDFVQPSGAHVVDEAANAVTVWDERTCLDASDRLTHVVVGVGKRFEGERRTDAE